ncbi:MAG: two-component sensor histidine kinase [Acidimicrobiia bacterium]|nr:MAG: two-component sensor histidine kinase [Acidimicrobiia bacterium]
MFVKSGSPSVWWPLNAGILAAVLTLLTDQLEGWGGRALSFVAVVAVTWGAVEVTRRWAVSLAERRTGAIVEELTHAKERLIANVSHGLRTPLTGIVGFAHVLSERLRDPEDREACSAILSQAAELGRIVDDLVTSARVDAGLVDVTPVEVWVSEQLDQVVEFLDLLGVPVNVDCEEALVRVDPEKFRQVLRNLVVNAHQHGRPQVRVEGGVRGDRYILSVVDRGPGVPVELQPVMFERFPDRPDRPIVGEGRPGVAGGSGAVPDDGRRDHLPEAQRGDPLRTLGPSGGRSQRAHQGDGETRAAGADGRPSGARTRLSPGFSTLGATPA